MFFQNTFILLSNCKANKFKQKTKANEHNAIHYRASKQSDNSRYIKLPHGD